VVYLEKHAKATHQNAYRVVSEILTHSTRQRAEVNLSHLNGMAETAKDKVLVVPGVVLGKGTLTHAIEVAALRYSGSAQQKIRDANGKAWLLEELVSNKVPAQKLVLVK
jgi:large subunit ribosomal protein L18e